MLPDQGSRRPRAAGETQALPQSARVLLSALCPTPQVAAHQGRRGPAGKTVKTQGGACGQLLQHIPSMMLSISRGANPGRVASLPSKAPRARRTLPGYGRARQGPSRPGDFHRLARAEFSNRGGLGPLPIIRFTQNLVAIDGKTFD